MKSVGIIAEYNPFHNGHAHQLSFLKNQGADMIAIALSGNFVQRGNPAWTDKYLRTRMALEQGADFVFELPTLYALSSAEGFAFGGVSLLNALPLDSLCFGSECGTISPLQTVADFLVLHDNGIHAIESSYTKQLQTQLKKGLSFPAAREQTLQSFFPELLSQYPTLLSSSNNILAIEYLKALKKIKSPLHSVTLTRNDAGYHSDHLGKSTASATAIRKAYNDTTSLESCQNVLPKAVYQLLSNHPTRYPVQLDDFSELVYLRLRQAKQAEDYTAYGDISLELARRLWKLLPEYTSLSSYIEQVKSKNYTYTRISRSLMHLLLHITKEQLEAARQEVPYLRLLGMRQTKSSFLRDITSLPVITKVADYSSVLTNFYNNQEQYTDKQKQSRLNFALDCFETDLFAADIYRQTVQHKLNDSLPDEYRNGIEIYRDTNNQ